MATRVTLWTVGIVAVLAATAYLAFRLSPWPSALMVRRVMDRGGVEAARMLERHVPPGVTALAGERYSDHADARLDVFFPAGADTLLPVVVWVHGGGFVSGSRDHVANYLKILAARGYTTVAVDYTLAPGGRYPLPVAQVNAALLYLEKNADRLHADPARVILAGDSAGAQIAAQLALIIGDPSYAAGVGIAPSIPRSRLRGVVLFCGIYDVGLLDLSGSFGGFLRTVIWSYFGMKHLDDDPRLDAFSVARHVTAAFPPAFVSAGNDDPLEAHSRALARAIAARGVPVETLFFPDEHTPPLSHEYQFNLDTDSGRAALEGVAAFLAARSP